MACPNSEVAAIGAETRLRLTINPATEGNRQIRAAVNGRIPPAADLPDALARCTGESGRALRRLTEVISDAHSARVPILAGTDFRTEPGAMPDYPMARRFKQRRLTQPGQ